MTDQGGPGARVPGWSVLAILAVALGACIPMKFSVYRVSGPGKTESAYCAAGLEDVLRVEAPNDVDIVFFAGEYVPERPTDLGVSIYVPPGVRFRLTTPEVLLESVAWSQPRRLLVKAVLGPGGNAESGMDQHLPTQAFGGVTENPLFGTEFVREAHLWFEPGANTPSRAVVPPVRTFSVTLPTVEINGEPFEVGPVTFTADRQWGIYTCIQ